MLNSGMGNLVQEIVSTGVAKELNSEIRYIVIYDKV